MFLNEEEVVDTAPEEFDDTEVLEHIRARQSAHEVKASDIVTMQCIFCIILAILAIVLNLLMPQFTEKLIERFKVESFSPAETNEALAAIMSQISDFMNATPNGRV